VDLVTLNTVTAADQTQNISTCMLYSICKKVYNENILRYEETEDCCQYSGTDLINPQWLDFPSYTLREIQNQLNIYSMSKEIIRRIGMI
jgi:hypothetical protein